MSANRNTESRLIGVREDLLPLSLLLLLVIVFLHKGIFPLDGTQVLSSQSTDTGSYFFPILTFGNDSLSKGILPLWNPYIYSGSPYVATLQTAIFYPLNWLYILLPLSTAINLNIAFHLFLSGCFTYYLLKHHGVGRFGATISGIVYMFAAPHIMHIYAGHLVLISAITWTPLMFLLLDKLINADSWRCGVLLSFTIALQLLAGYPQDLFYSMIMLSFYLLYNLIRLGIEGNKRGNLLAKGLMFSIAVILGLALSAVQILPTVEMTKYSTRENLSYEWVSIFSFPPENLITFLIPDFFGDMLKTPYWGKNYLWEMTAYVGIMPLVLAGIAAFYVRNRVVWFFAGLAVFSVVLAFGKHTPLLKLLYNVVPGFNLFRGNSKFIFLNALSIAVLSGFGADAVVRGFDDLKKRLRPFAITLIVLVSLGMFIGYAAFDAPFFREAINGVVSSGDLFNNPEPVMKRGFEFLAAASFKGSLLWTTAFLVSGMALLLLSSYGVLKEKALMAALAALVIIDLFSFGMRYMVTFDSKESYWDSDVVRFLKQDKEPFRVVAPDMDVNGGMVAGLETLGGYDTIMVKRYSEFINLSQGASPDKPNLWVDINDMNKLTDLLNARYLVLPSAERYDNPVFRPVFDNGRNRIYRNISAFPRAFVVHAAKVITDRESILREMETPEFNPSAYAIVEEPDLHLGNPMAKSPLPKFIEHSPNRVRIEAYLNHPGLLVLGDVWYPGWKAFVDGKETKIYKANYVMRGVALAEGTHRVEFLYDPLSFKIGAAITLLSLALAAAILIWDWRRNEKTEIAS